jgi:hypothetical protein
MVVATQQRIYDAYLKIFKTLPKDVTPKFLLLSKTDLSELNPKYFGERGKTPGISAQTMRTRSQDGIEYFSTISCERDSAVPPLIDTSISPVTKTESRGNDL